MRIPITAADWLVVAPELVLLGTAIIILMLDAFAKQVSDRVSAWFALAGVVGAGIVLGLSWEIHRTAFLGMIAADAFGLLIKVAILVGTFLTILLSAGYIRREELLHGEYYALILFSAIGMLLLASSANLIMVFLSLEILSIALYILTGFAPTRKRSQEAGMKYFLLGSFSAAILIYGTALIFGSAGTIDLKSLATRLPSADPVLLAGMGLVAVGLGFKVAAVPFHMWTPDVYEGAPSPITAFMSIGSKAAAFAALARVLIFGFAGLKSVWVPGIWVIAAITMALGNIVAIAQDNIKRMLAYSSIAHAGYILVAVTSASRLGVQSIVYYLLAYAFMNLGAWAVVIALTKKGEGGVYLSDYTGLFWRNPMLAGAMALFMFALAGLPPTAGFTAKFYVFAAAVNSNLIGLLIITIITTVISAYFYLRVAIVMFMQKPEDEEPAVRVSPSVAIVITIAAVATLWLFLFPNTTRAFTDAVWRVLI